jgi:hypothetical protein
MKKIVAVIDGMGGGIGVHLVEKLRETGMDIEIIALGANAIATGHMINAGAHRGATGENAIKVSVQHVDFITGPIGIVIANSLMGEISPPIALAILSARAERILIPLQNEHFQLVGLEHLTLTNVIEQAVEIIKKKCLKTELRSSKKTVKVVPLPKEDNHTLTPESPP